MEPSGAPRPVVDAEACTACGLCIVDCPPLVFELEDGKAVAVRADWCIGCGHCAALCPTGAISHPALAAADAPRPSRRRPAVAPEPLLLLLRERRSVRAYKDRPLDRPIVERILDAGRHAPTGSNSENVHYVVLHDPDAIEGLRRRVVTFYERLFARMRNPIARLAISLVAGRAAARRLDDYRPLLEVAQERMAHGEDRLFYGAKAVVIAHAEAGDDSSAFNCAVALYNCSLMAHSLGVGCCFNGFTEAAVGHSRELRRWLEIPNDHRCFGAMGMGWQKVRYGRLVERQPAKATWR